MAAPHGNSFWRRRSKHAAKAPLYSDPEDLRKACEEYFEYVEANPLYATQAISFQGRAHNHQVPKPRAMTVTGLCLFIGISTDLWYAWQKSTRREHREDLLNIIAWAAAVIRTQKYEGAAAGLFDARIVARELSLNWDDPEKPSDDVFDFDKLRR